MNAHQRRKHARAKFLAMDKREPGTWEAVKLPFMRSSATWAGEWSECRFNLTPTDPAYLVRY